MITVRKESGVYFVTCAERGIEAEFASVEDAAAFAAHLSNYV